MELDFGQLGDLLAIEQEGSFTGAAARPKMSRRPCRRPSHSWNGRSGVPSSRGRHGARLTDASRMLVGHAQLIEIRWTAPSRMCCIIGPVIFLILVIPLLGE